MEIDRQFLKGSISLLLLNLLSRGEMYGYEILQEASRRSAQAFVDAARATDMFEAALRPVHYCLSTQVAEPLAAAGAADIRIAPSPAEAALIALIDAA